MGRLDRSHRTADILIRFLRHSQSAHPRHPGATLAIHSVWNAKERPNSPPYDGIRESID